MRGLLLLSLLIGVGACVDDNAEYNPGCKTDRDCKGDRVCDEDHVCRALSEVRSSDEKPDALDPFRVPDGARGSVDAGEVNSLADSGSIVDGAGFDGFENEDGEVGPPEPGEGACGVVLTSLAGAWRGAQRHPGESCDAFEEDPHEAPVETYCPRWLWHCEIEPHTMDVCADTVSGPLCRGWEVGSAFTGRMCVPVREECAAPAL